ncbi:VanZ family protein [Streptacidiphilus anmyonensis]|uniref:VanZ family protein n=1 Tax=Streptacidiphilus anmyonensis TaxID=405782 RepID=UPI000B231304|nr:VanZ family protein [Streptacidiphilus anmyonensis]
MFSASVAGVLCLVFMGSSGHARYTCTINPHWADAFLTEQGQLNIALFVPMSALAVLVFRSPLVALLMGSALSLAIEVTQATVAPLARTCDSTDWTANTLGAAVGAGLAWSLLVLASRSVSLTIHLRPVLIGALGTAGVCLTVFLSCVQPVLAAPSGISDASPSMRTAVERALKQAFGTTYRISGVSYISTDHVVLVNLDGGSASLTWPGGSNPSQLVVNLRPEQQGVPADQATSFPVAGTQRPSSASDAAAIARRYAAEHFPDVLKGSTADIQSAADGRLGWDIDIRRVVNGVLMPMRFTVGIDTVGHVRDLLVQDTPDPARLPPTTLTEQQALASVARTSATAEPSPTGPGLLLVRREAGAWRVAWAFPMGVNGQAAGTAYVDATTGRLLTP